MEIVRKYLSADELTPPGTRYNPDTDTVQTSPDGGTTWVDNPAADPRHGATFRAPPLSGDTARCNAAANIVAAIRANVDTAIAAAAALELANSLLSIILAFIPGGVLLAALIWAVGTSIIAFGSVALVAAFTEAAYDALLCALLDHLDSDGQMSNDQLVDFVEYVEANMDSVVHAVILQTSRMWGPVGFSNAGAVGSEVGDCDECDWCYTINLADEDGGFVAGCTEYPGLENCDATWTDGVGWQGIMGPTAEGLTRFMIVVLTFPETFIHTVIAGGSVIGMGNASSPCSTLRSHDPLTGGLAQACGGAGSSDVVGVELEVEALCSYLLFVITSEAPVGAGATGTPTGTFITITGKGDMPVGWVDNC